MAHILPFAVPTLEPAEFRSALLKEALSQFAVATGQSPTSHEKLIEWADREAICEPFTGKRDLSASATRRKAARYVDVLKEILASIDDACTKMDVVAALVTVGPNYGSAQPSSHSLLIVLEEAARQELLHPACTCAASATKKGCGEGMAIESACVVVGVSPPAVPLQKLVTAGRRKVARFFITEGWETIEVDAAGTRSLLPSTNKLYLSLLVAKEEAEAVRADNKASFERPEDSKLEGQKMDCEDVTAEDGDDLLEGLAASFTLSCGVSSSSARLGSGPLSSPAPISFIPVDSRSPVVPAPVLKHLRRSLGLPADDKTIGPSAKSSALAVDWNAFLEGKEPSPEKEGRGRHIADTVSSVSTSSKLCRRCALAAALGNPITSGGSAASQEEGSAMKPHAAGVRPVARKTSGRGSVLVLRCGDDDSTGDHSSHRSVLPLPALIAGGLETETRLLLRPSTDALPLKWVRLSQPLPPFPPGIGVALF
jgi:hypothetical protein